MGSKPIFSEPPPYPSTPSNATFACITLNENDKIRFIRFPQPVIDMIRQCIIGSWPRGIQNEREYHGAWEYKLRGNPWYAQGDQAVPSRSLMSSIFASLWGAGWILVQSVDVSKKLRDKDSLIFQYQSVQQPPSMFCSISFNETDKLRLIDGPEDLRSVIDTVLAPRLQSVKWKTPNAYQWKLKGTLWHAEGGETVYCRMLVLDLLSALESCGWKLYASIDQCVGTSENTSETDSWHLVKSSHWVPGMMVYAENHH